MTMREVLSFQLAWDANTELGYAALHLKGKRKPVEISALKSQDLSALALVLRESPVYFREDGVVLTDWKPVTAENPVPSTTTRFRY